MEFDSNTQNYELFLAQGEAFHKEEIKYISKKGENLYFSSYGKSLHRFNLKTKKEYPFSVENVGTYIKDLEEDEEGNVWLAPSTYEFLAVYDPKTRKLVSEFPVKGSTETIRFINTQDVLVDSAAVVWIATRNNGVYRYNYATRELKAYKAHYPDTTTISSNNVSVLFKDSDNNLWLGTYGGGVCLYDRKSDTFHTFDHTNGLSSNVICGILEDERKNIWVTNQLGISCLSRKDLRFTNYTQLNGFPLQEINMHACMKSRNGTFYIGGSNGFVSFRPNELKKNPHIPRIVISDFKIWNTSVKDQTDRLSLHAASAVRLK